MEITNKNKLHWSGYNFYGRKNKLNIFNKLIHERKGKL